MYAVPCKWNVFWVIYCHSPGNFGHSDTAHCIKKGQIISHSTACSCNEFDFDSGRIGTTAPTVHEIPCRNAMSQAMHVTYAMEDQEFWQAVDLLSRRTAEGLARVFSVLTCSIGWMVPPEPRDIKVESTMNMACVESADSSTWAYTHTRIYIQSIVIMESLYSSVLMSVKEANWFSSTTTKRCDSLLAGAMYSVMSDRSHGNSLS